MLNETPKALLAHDFARVFVLPQPEKKGVTQVVIPSPLREPHLANEHRLDPAAGSHLTA